MRSPTSISCRLSLALAALSLCLITPPAGQADNQKNCGCKKREQVYKSVIVGLGPAPDFSPGNRCAPGGTASVPGTGHDTVLGSFNSTQSHCITPGSLAFTNGQFTATQTADADGNGVLDTLTGNYGGTLVPTAQPNVLMIDGRFIFATSTGLVGKGIASGRIVFNQDGTADAIVAIDGCVAEERDRRDETAFPF